VRKLYEEELDKEIAALSPQHEQAIELISQAYEILKTTDQQIHIKNENLKLEAGKFARFAGEESHRVVPTRSFLEPFNIMVIRN
ncbi:hypothetical protein OSK45_29050, partial [Escherichia coli]|nr:hypothetical protein [Escherichia coli]